MAGGSAVNDVSVEISVVLGKATMPIHQVLKVGRGAVIELIARGEIVISGEKVAVSITDTMSDD
jgi:flagellar motor switch protein FliN/FliY